MTPLPRKVYLVGPIDCDYDEHDAFVVVATDEAEARQLAIAAAANPDSFRDAPVRCVGITDEACGVILGSFNAG
jgi:hypothetical protein